MRQLEQASGLGLVPAWVSDYQFFTEPMFADKSTVQLALGFVLFLVTGVVSVYMLCNSDVETRRLLDLYKLWTRRASEDVSMRLHQVKRNFMVGYWFFLLVSILGLFLFAFALISRVNV